MQTILSKLFDHYNCFVPDAEPLQKVENAHKQLLAFEIVKSIPRPGCTLTA